MNERGLKLLKVATESLNGSLIDSLNESKVVESIRYAMDDVGVDYQGNIRYIYIRVDLPKDMLVSELLTALEKKHGKKIRALKLLWKMKNECIEVTIENGQVESSVYRPRQLNVTSKDVKLVNQMIKDLYLSKFVFSPSIMGYLPGNDMLSYCNISQKKKDEIRERGKALEEYKQLAFSVFNLSLQTHKHYYRKGNGWKIRTCEFILKELEKMP